VGFHEAEWRTHGIRFIACERTTSENYLSALSLMLAQRCRLVDNMPLRTQLWIIPTRYLGAHCSIRRRRPDVEVGGYSNRDGRLADSAPEPARRHDDRFDLGHFGDPHHVVAVEILLLDATVLHRACQPVDKRTCNLECAPGAGQVEVSDLTECELGFQRMKAMARQRSHSIAFKRQVAKRPSVSASPYRPGLLCIGDAAHAMSRAFAAIDGVPRRLVPDNAKVAVIKACLYEPQVNRTYAEMAAHYGTAVLPARPHRPRDKAKVEAAVLVIERWILARLRNQRFYNLAELNAAIGELLKRLNDERPIRRLATFPLIFPLKAAKFLLPATGPRSRPRRRHRFPPAARKCMPWVARSYRYQHGLAANVMTCV
jgi:hypothetical protein